MSSANSKKVPEILLSESRKLSETPSLGLVYVQPTISADALLQLLRNTMLTVSVSRIIRYAKDWLYSILSFDCLECAVWNSDFAAAASELDREVKTAKLERASEEPVIEFLDSCTWADTTPVVCRVASLLEYFPATVTRLQTAGAVLCCVAPIQVGIKPCGVLILGRANSESFSDSALHVIAHAATILGFAFDHAITTENTRRNQVVQSEECDCLQMVQRTSEAVASELDLHKLLYKISESIQNIMRIEYTDLMLSDPVKGVMRRLAVSYQGKGLMKEDFDEPMCESPAHRAFTLRQPVICRLPEMKEIAHNVEALQFLLEEGFQETCHIPLVNHGRTLGTLNVCSYEIGKFTPACIALLREIAQPIAVAVDNALAYRKISELRDRLACEKKYLEGEIHTHWRFEEIIGESPALKTVLDLVETVADSNANVLILGETGTGKELIARALHNLSSRKDRTFVKFNCAAMPAGLLESELFGYEKGAFTGAVAPKAGLIEVANKGTLFLDEIGDLPLELQPKLLRVLQEQQFLHLGSTHTIQVDVRVIAATNRDLKQMVAENQFRADLFYRLNVVPLAIPPLRERRDDIPLLIRYFVQKYARLMRRSIESIPSEAMEALMQWDWPGNIRELENLIERAVILSKGTVLNVPTAGLREEHVPSHAVQNFSQANLSREVELSSEDLAQREKIMSALSRCHGVVAGPHGAAVSLGMKRTTFLGKMQRLGIVMKREYR